MVLFGYALLGLLTLWVQATILRTLLAVFLTLFGPGYSLMAVLFPRRDELDAVERAALAGGLSLAVGGVIGFLLTWTPWGLSLTSVLVESSLFSLGCLVFVWTHRPRLTAERLKETGPSLLTRPQQWWVGQGRASGWVTVVLGALLVAGAAALGWNLMVPTADPPMTEFYLLNSNGQVQDYPITIVPGQALRMTFGVTNRENRPASYDVRVSMGGQLLDDSGSMVLQPGETWLSDLNLLLPRDAAARLDAETVEFILERDGQPYRSLHLWLAVENADPVAAATELAE